MAASAALETAWACTSTFGVDLTAGEDLDERALANDTSLPTSISSVDRRLVERRRACRRLTAEYSTRNGLLKPFSFGTRCLSGIWPPSKPRPHGVAGVLSLGATAGGLAALAADATTDALGLLGGAGRRGEIVDAAWSALLAPSLLDAFAALTVTTVMRCGTRAIMPRISGRSGSVLVLPIRPRPRARSVPRVLGLEPIPERTWVTVI